MASAPGGLSELWWERCQEGGSFVGGVRVWRSLSGTSIGSPILSIFSQGWGIHFAPDQSPIVKLFSCHNECMSARISVPSHGDIIASLNTKGAPKHLSILVCDVFRVHSDFKRENCHISYFFFQHSFP